MVHFWVEIMIYLVAILLGAVRYIIKYVEDNVKGRFSCADGSRQAYVVTLVNCSVNKRKFEVSMHLHHMSRCAGHFSASALPSHPNYPHKS